VAKKAKAKTAKTAAKSKKAKKVVTKAAAKTATKAKAAKKGKITRREYTKEDIKELKAHSKARTPVAEIARLTNRTVGSLRQKALKLGIGLGHQR
jgi:vacuolar-type H+-ATPase subunit I/STV1